MSSPNPKDQLMTGVNATSDLTLNILVILRT